MKKIDLRSVVTIAIVVFFLVIVFTMFLSLLSNVLFHKDISYLLWMIFPSVIYEELLETCCYNLSNNKIMNLSFIIGFWFIIGLLIGVIIELSKFKKAHY